MIIKSNDLKTTEVNELRGGNGVTSIKYILDSEGLENNGKMYAILTLKKGCSLGYHEHSGEFEAIYVLKGKAWYNDNGDMKILQTGDLAICKSGFSHCIGNDNDEELQLLCLILNNGK